MINDLYRAAHVLRVGSYWLRLAQQIRIVIASSLVVRHNDHEVDPAHAAVARDIVALTLGEGLSDERVPRRKQEDMKELVNLFDWCTDLFTYNCPIPDCAGGDACKRHAVDALSLTAMRTVFARRPVIPSLSRWWKVTPLARQVLLGVALHG